MIGTGTKNDQQAYAEGVVEECMSDEEDAILEAADPDDPKYVVLGSQLLVGALADCTKKALADNLNNVHCDPFDPEFDGIAQLARLEGPCLLSLANGLKGTPLKKNAYCPDKPAEEAGNESTTGDTDNDSDTTAALLPTTSAGPTDEQLAAMIACDDGTCRISRALIDAALTNPAALLADTTLLPFARDGQVVGVVFTSVAPGSLPDRLGFHSDEVITAVDGHPLTTAEDLLFLASTALEGDSITVTTHDGSRRVDHIFTRH